MKSFKYSSSQQPIIRVVEMETPHHYTYHHPREGGGGTTTTTTTAAAIEESELSIFDAQKYFNEPHDSPNQEKETNAAPQPTSPSPPPPTTTYDPPFHDLPTSLPRRLSSSASSSAAYSHGTKGHRDSVGSGIRCFSFPTASSEASWNSQTGLLANPPVHSSEPFDLMEATTSIADVAVEDEKSSSFNWLSL